MKLYFGKDNTINLKIILNGVVYIPQLGLPYNIINLLCTSDELVLQDSDGVYLACKGE